MEDFQTLNKPLQFNPNSAKYLDIHTLFIMQRDKTLFQ